MTASDRALIEEGDALLEAVVNETDTNTRARGRLIELLFLGYPLARLQPLLESSDRGLVADGLYILSEMGQRGRPLLGAAVACLNHEYADARYYALDIVLSCSEAADGGGVAKALALVEDNTDRVRAKTIDLMAKKGASILDAAREIQCATYGDQRHCAGLSLLLAPTPEGAQSFLIGDMLQRGYGLATAARLGERGCFALKNATNSSDPVIAMMALRFLARCAQTGGTT